MARSDEEKIADEMLILRLLAGFHEDKRGRPAISYLKPGSPEAKRAQAIIAQQLLDGTLSYKTRELLALAFDPNCPAFPGMRPTRKIQLINATRGKPSAWARNLAVVHFIERRFLEGSTKPYHDAAAYFPKLNYKNAQAIWTKYEKWRATLSTPLMVNEIVRRKQLAAGEKLLARLERKRRVQVRDRKPPASSK